ncbi:MAG: hypothetical protein HA491_04975, partial [Candidatus Verstraetearchaeota archaeon]|nr:hypothetical protein [Candidatus Verstraetearchaeota archaeon]
MFRRTIGLGVIVAFVIVSLVYGAIPNSAFSPVIARYAYSCNFTFVVQGDISGLGEVNRMMIFPNTTKQYVFIEEAKGVIDNVEYRGSLVSDEQGNAILVFDFPNIVKGQSIVTIYVRATIIQRADKGSVPIDELRKVLLSDVPLSLAERY